MEVFKLKPLSSALTCLRLSLALTIQISFASTAKKDLPLGIEDRKIPDRCLTASSEWNKNHGARFGRLNTVVGGRNKGAWSAKRNNRRQYIMVSLPSILSFVLPARDFLLKVKTVVTRQRQY